MILQEICNSSHQQIGIIKKRAESLVAAPAQQSSDLASFVVVVNSQSIACCTHLSADRAHAVLSIKDLVVFRHRDSEVVLELVRPTKFLTPFSVINLPLPALLAVPRQSFWMLLVPLANPSGDTWLTDTTGELANGLNLVACRAFFDAHTFTLHREKMLVSESAVMTGQPGKYWSQKVWTRLNAAIWDGLGRQGMQIVARIISPLSPRIGPDRAQCRCSKRVKDIRFGVSRS